MPRCGPFRGKTVSGSSEMVWVSNSRTSSVGVAAAVLEDEIHPPGLTVGHQVAGLGDVDGRLAGLGGVGQEDPPPAAVVLGDVAHVQHLARKVLEEHAGLDVVLRAGRHDAVGDFAEGLVGVRDGHDEDVERDAGGRDGEDHDGPEQPVEADAAGQQGHRLTVAGETAEADEQAHEQGHGDGDAEGLGDQRQDDPDDVGEGDALGEQGLGLLHDGLDDQEEREHEERQEERRQRPRESRSGRAFGSCSSQEPGPGGQRPGPGVGTSPRTSGPCTGGPGEGEGAGRGFSAARASSRLRLARNAAGGSAVGAVGGAVGASARELGPQSMHRAVLLGFSVESDNVCYVNL